jgi:hypothetical protein
MALELDEIVSAEWTSSLHLTKVYKLQSCQGRVSTILTLYL